MLCGRVVFAQGGMMPGPGTPHSAGGGPTFDAASSANVANNAGSTLTWAHTNSGNAMCVGLYTYSGGGVTISNVKYAGSASFTKKTNSSSIGIGTNTEIHCSDGITLATGSNNVVITASGTGNYISAWAISVTGGNVSSPIGTSGVSANGSSGTATSATITSAAGQIIFDIVGNDSSDASMTPGGGQTQRMAPQGTILQGAGSTKAGAASTTTSWTLGGSEAWAVSAGSFQ